jgi:hypothetical protein
LALSERDLNKLEIHALLNHSSKQLRKKWQHSGLLPFGLCWVTTAVAIGLLFTLFYPLIALGQSEQRNPGPNGDVRKLERRGAVRTKVLKSETRTEDGHKAGTGIAIFMGLTGGLLNIQTDVPELESEKSGYYLAGKSLLSFYQTNWVFDLGLGWFYGQASSNSDPGSGETPPDLVPTPVQIGLNAGLIEVAPRFRLTDNWQIGLVLNGFVSTDDVSFSGLVADAENKQPFALLG